jgi:hypothetical protein
MRYEGHGLVYYLNGPPAQRLVTGAIDSRQRRQALVDMLAQPVLQGHTQYLVLPRNDQSKYDWCFGEEFDVLPFSPKWVVWRRKHSEARLVKAPLTLREMRKLAVVRQEAGEPGTSSSLRMKTLTHLANAQGSHATSR